MANAIPEVEVVQGVGKSSGRPYKAIKLHIRVGDRLYSSDLLFPEFHEVNELGQRISVF